MCIAQGDVNQLRLDLDPEPHGFHSSVVCVCGIQVVKPLPSYFITIGAIL